MSPDVLLAWADHMVPNHTPHIPLSTVNPERVSTLGSVLPMLPTNSAVSDYAEISFNINTMSLNQDYMRNGYFAKSLKCIFHTVVTYSILSVVRYVKINVNS